MLNFALIFLLNVALASMVILLIALLAARMVVSLPLKHAFLMTGLVAILVAPAVIGVGLSQGWGQLSWPEISGLSQASAQHQSSSSHCTSLYHASSAASELARAVMMRVLW